MQVPGYCDLGSLWQVQSEFLSKVTFPGHTGHLLWFPQLLFM